MKQLCNIRGIVWGRNTDLYYENGNLFISCNPCV